MCTTLNRDCLVILLENVETCRTATHFAAVARARFVAIVGQYTKIQTQKMYRVLRLTSHRKLACQED